MISKENYLQLKQKALKKYFERMNEQQADAVFTINGPLLILAGAGSGKTTVLVNRIANMIFFGDAYNSYDVSDTVSDAEIKFLQDFADGKTSDSEMLKNIVATGCVNPWNILAITFTNKAAGELRERLENLLGEQSQGIVAATFHSCCVRILRREIDKLGYTSSFTIYDSDDTQRVIKSLLAELEISEKMFPPRSIQGEISRQKDCGITPDEYEKAAAGDYRKLVIAKAYKAYQKRLKDANAVDFDDIICLTVRLFEENPDVLNHYQNLYKYVLVDEYQDTNQVQYRLVSMLSAKSGNLCVVGDDDQSIYKFRGATIENILSFEDEFKNAKVIRLEQNYRSTQNILTVANELIKNNTGRKGKNLWTASGDGSMIKVYKAQSEAGEAKHVVDVILDDIKKGGKYNDHAVLYRMNAQSNALEKAMISAGIPYKIIGGMKFYDRKEVKDMLAYLQVIDNPADMLRFKRIVNEPKRGLGNATISIVEQISSDLGISPIEVLRNSAEYAPVAKKSKGLKEVATMFDHFTKVAEEESLEDLLDTVLMESGYSKMLRELGEEGQTRLENINELKSSMANYSESAEEPTLAGFLEEVALYTDVDNLDENADYVVMMTMHSAKGLEFPDVFIVGMEEGIFPGMRSMDSEDDIAEERRLAYVAVTRAKKNLYISHAVSRMLFGNTTRNRPSRFLKELPSDYLEHSQQEMVGMQSSNSGSGISQTMNMSLQAQLANKKRTDPHTNSNVVYSAGDRVKHNIFGEGTVLVATKTANDYMLEVAFDSKGTKKIMANFAKIKKI